ncbi:DUF4181 domain-containing protein [Ornithinibacillus salinisoli]|uniref:DUF4181 domain-containing protein n=1 Tax=Ornithinibacillus salinisoli TaxID=1848459 RepID=A0ABW4W497_9BACI
MIEFWIKLLPLLSLIVLILLISDHFLRKWLEINKDNKKSYANRIHSSGILLIVLIFIFIISIYHHLSTVNTGNLLIVFIIVASGFDAFMQWKYLHNSKEYIITLTKGILLIIIVLLTMHFNLLKLIFEN